MLCACLLCGYRDDCYGRWTLLPVWTTDDSLLLVWMPSCRLIDELTPAPGACACACAELQLMEADKRRQAEANRNKQAAKEKALSKQKKEREKIAKKHEDTFGGTFDEVSREHDVRPSSTCLFLGGDLGCEGEEKRHDMLNSAHQSPVGT
jgi:hypothetical protein